MLRALARHGGRRLWGRGRQESAERVPRVHSQERHGLVADPGRTPLEPLRASGEGGVKVDLRIIIIIIIVSQR